jgi:hypothetical protein
MPKPGVREPQIREMCSRVAGARTAEEFSAALLRLKRAVRRYRLQSDRPDLEVMLQITASQFKRPPQRQ